MLYVLSHRFPEAEKAITSIWEAAGKPNGNILINSVGAIGYAMQENWKYASDLLDRIEPAETSGYTFEVFGYHAYFLYKAGDEAASRGMYEAIAKDHRRGMYCAFGHAIAAIPFQSAEAVIDLLEQAAREVEPPVIWIGILPWFRPISHHPRFLALLAQLRLPLLHS